MRCVCCECFWHQCYIIITLMLNCCWNESETWKKKIMLQTCCRQIRNKWFHFIPFHFISFHTVVYLHHHCHTIFCLWLVPLKSRRLHDTLTHWLAASTTGDKYFYVAFRFYFSLLDFQYFILFFSALLTQKMDVNT